MNIFLAYDNHLEQLTEVAAKVCRALDAAEIEYRIIGGLAVFFHVYARDPVAARLTRDVDLAVKRADLDRIAQAVLPFGFKLRHAAGVDMLIDSAGGKDRSPVHLVFLGEKVRREYPEAVPQSSPMRNDQGYLLAPVKDLLVMKLTSFRAKDRAHIIDMDGVGLITPEIEAALPEVLRERLERVRLDEAQSGAE